MDWQELRPEPEDTLNDALDQAIRHALRQEAGRVVPPERVWHRINSQISAGPTRPRRRLAAPSRGSLLAPLVQGLAAMVLVLLVGLNILPYVVVEHPAAITETTPLPADLPTPAGADSLPATSIPSRDPLENIDTLKASLRQQQRQLQASAPAESEAVRPASDQEAAASLSRAHKNPTAAVQPSEDQNWSPPRPRSPAVRPVLPRAPRF